MDQSTKQRLVGAVVLVVAVLWIVPVFLDGPAPETDTISETVNLPGLEATPTEQRRIDLREPLPSANSAAATESTSTASAEPIELPTEPLVATTDEAPADEPTEPPPGPPPSDDAAPQDDKPAPTVVESTPSAPPARATAEPATSAADASPPVTVPADGLWAVQLGSFSDRENASRLAAGLRADGISAFLTEIDRDGKTLHRVRVGPVADRPAAERLVTELSRKGHSARVVQHP